MEESKPHLRLPNVRQYVVVQAWSNTDNLFVTILGIIGNDGRLKMSRGMAASYPSGNAAKVCNCRQ